MKPALSLALIVLVAATSMPAAPEGTRGRVDPGSVSDWT